MKKILVITGPTAVGKTKLSIELAKKYNGEIINADAVQVYKGLDIGSAKVTEEEKEGIPHYLLSIKEVDEDYTIYHYQKDCREIIKEIQDRGKTPIIVGGTGLYIKAALYDYKLTEEKEKDTYDNLTNEELYKKLTELDKDIIIDKNNRRRLIRAINYYKENNKSIGITLNPDTPIEQIIPYLNYANIALVMSVKPGFGGQSFIENSLEKILFLKEYREKYNLKYEIEVDGGINAYTSKLCRESGSDILVAGSYIFSSTDYKQKIKELNNENL